MVWYKRYTYIITEENFVYSPVQAQIILARIAVTHYLIVVDCRNVDCCLRGAFRLQLQMMRGSEQVRCTKARSNIMIYHHQSTSDHSDDSHLFFLHMLHRCPGPGACMSQPLFHRRIRLPLRWARAILKFNCVIMVWDSFPRQSSS